MKLLRSTLLSSTLLALSCTGAALAQDAAPMPMPAPASGKPMPSPPATASVTLAGKAITIKYNSPSLRGRKAIGELVPFDKVWRTGANPATSFVTEGDVMIDTLKIPAGSYTLYTLPEAAGKPWMLIINKQTGQWGTVYKEDMDLGRVPMKSATLPAPQEMMSITFEKSTQNGTQMHIKWETIDQWVKIVAAK